MTFLAPPAFHETLRAALLAWDNARSTARVWAKSASLWTDRGEQKWLGWLDAALAEPAQLDALERRVKTATPDGTRDVLLIGMGGSSLAPEVISRVLPRQHDGCTIRILDSTEPSAVRAALDDTQWHHCTCVVASKSGSTLEPDILMAAALERARIKLADAAPRRFIAITDPGSQLEMTAQRLGFAATFPGDPSIGGRFSALSPFGLVPAALHGANLSGFIAPARALADACRADAPVNPGVQLGVFLGACARADRNKLTLLLPDTLAPLGAWIEQLVAESTGKNGVAILPIDGEVIPDAVRYSGDRAFVHVRDITTPAANGRATTAFLDALAALGHPVYSIESGGATELAAEFFRWEFATAVAGAMLGVNPFDQPDVESAKIATRALVEAHERGDANAATGLADDHPAGLRVLFASLARGDYVALLAYLPMTENVRAQLERTRMRIRDAHRVATTLGFGPRYLHSTGQAFKGGPNTGVFVVLTCDAPRDSAIPGRRATFGTVIAAQAAGDRQVLRERGRRVLHVHLRGDLSEALASFDDDVKHALAGGLTA